MLVLCNGCGMRVLLQADGSCPSCGAKGEVVGRIWRGESVNVLVPAPTSISPSHACLCLRPYAIRFRSAARLRAVSHAMRPFGTTVALLDDTDTPYRWAKVPTITFGMTSLVDLLFAAMDGLWKLLRRRGVTLVGRVDDDRWRSTFRRLALRSRLLVMDVSASGSGLTYEAEYISDLELADRLIIIHAAGSAVDATIERLQAHGIHPPVVLYQPWRLRRFAKELRHTAEVMLNVNA